MFTDLISNYNLKEGINTEITPEQASAIMRKQ